MRIILAYSGGLDTSTALHWLRVNYDAEVVAFCADVGQGGDLEAVRAKALATGAVDVVIDDLKQVYLDEFVWPAFKASAKYEGRYCMAAPLDRPLIGRRLAELAAEYGADAVAHGSTGKGNDQVRMYSGAVAHNPRIRVVAPCMEWELGSRADEVDYAARHDIPVDVGADSPYSMDGSLWGCSTELGPIDDVTVPAPADAWQMTVDPRNASDGIEVDIRLEAGIPVALDGERLGGVELVDRLNTIAGANAVGRVDIIENSLLGIKTRALYEAPAATVLHTVHDELESLVLDRETQHFKAGVSQRYAELVYYGQWFTELRRGLDHFVDYTQRHVTGTVRVRLYRGTVTVLERHADRPLYTDALSSHDSVDRFDHLAGAGFSYVWSMPQRVEALTRGEHLQGSD